VISQLGYNIFARPTALRQPGIHPQQKPKAQLGIATNVKYLCQYGRYKKDEGREEVLPGHIA